MSPEQRDITVYLTPASDIYALGLVLFELLTGRMYKNLRPGTTLHSLRDDVPVWLEDLLGKMLANDPQQRPWDGAEVADDRRCMQIWLIRAQHLRPDPI